jgi:co-chaperonin GroES (HSP10)
MEQAVFPGVNRLRHPVNSKQQRKPTMALNVRPVGDRILVEAAEEKDLKGKKGGIIIPDTAKEKPMESVVVALGTGKTDDNGKKVPFEVRKGEPRGHRLIIWQTKGIIRWQQNN